MALDPRIALGVQPVQIQSPFELAGQVAALRDAQQRNKLVEMQMRESERAMAEQNALRRVVSAPGLRAPDHRDADGNMALLVWERGPRRSVPTAP